MTIKWIISTILFVYTLFGFHVFAENQVLNEEELVALLSGKTVRGIYLDKNKEFIRYYDKDGEVKQNIDQEITDGKWYINNQGQRCIVWSGKGENCRVIVKDNELYKEFAIQKNGKRKLTVIYNKVIEGDSSGL